MTREREGKLFRTRPGGSAKWSNARVRAALAEILNPEVRPPIATLVDAAESLDPELLDELARQVAARRKFRHGS